MKNKYQPNVHYSNIEGFLESLSEKEKIIVENLRAIVLDTLPHCKEKLSFNVPFYALNKNICFIWPSSVGWSGIKEGVALGFTHGSKLEAEDFLSQGKRKSVCSKVFLSPQEIDPERIMSLLLASEILDKKITSK